MSARGALADQGLGGKMIRTFHSGAKDTSVAAAKDLRHLAKSRVTDNEEIVHMRGEKVQKDVYDMVPAASNQGLA